MAPLLGRGFVALLTRVASPGAGLRTELRFADGDEKCFELSRPSRG